MENSAELIDALDRRKEAFTPGDVGAEVAVWETAARLRAWYVVNRGTADHPLPSGFEIDGVGRLLGVYSTGQRAAAVAGEGGSVIAVPLPQALEWLASFAAHGVVGVVIDHPGPWTPLANLAHLAPSAPPPPDAPIVLAPHAQAAANAYAAAQNDENYVAAVRSIADERLFVAFAPQSDGAVPPSIVNGRGERIVMAFTGSDRVLAVYGGKAVRVEPRPGGDLLRLVGDRFDVLVIDPQHPSSFAVTPEWIARAFREDA